MKTISSITINKDIFKSLIQLISYNSAPDTSCSFIVVGPSGSGKTTLLRKLCTSLIKNKNNVVWIDGRSIFNSQDIIKRVEEQNADIVFIDDIDYFFVRTTIEEQLQTISHLKSNHRPVSIIATAEKYHDILVDNKMCFPGYFNIVQIPPLNMNVIWETLLTSEQQDRAKYLSTFLSPTILHAIEIYEIVKGRKGYDLLQLIERHSEYYTAEYQRLSHYSQNILNNLSNNANGLTMAELRQSTNLPTNILSSYIKTLKDKGIIDYERQNKGLTKYMIKDPLFRKWLMAEPMNKF